MTWLIGSLFAAGWAVQGVSYRKKGPLAQDMFPESLFEWVVLIIMLWGLWPFVVGWEVGKAVDIYTGDRKRGAS